MNGQKMKNIKKILFTSVMMSIFFLSSLCFSQEKSVLNFNNTESLTKFKKYKTEKNKISNVYPVYPSIPIIKSFSLTDYTIGLGFDGTYLYTFFIRSNNKKKIIKIDPERGSILENFEWTIDCCPKGIIWNGKHFYVLDKEMQTISVANIQFNYVRKLLNRYNSNDISYDGVNLVSVGYQSITWIDPQEGSIVKEAKCLGMNMNNVAWDGNYLWISYSNTLKYDEKYICKMDKNGNPIKKFKLIKKDGSIEGLVFDGQYLWCLYTDFESQQSTFYKLDIGIFPDKNIVDSTPKRDKIITKIYKKNPDYFIPLPIKRNIVHSKEEFIKYWDLRKKKYCVVSIENKNETYNNLFDRIQISFNSKFEKNLYFSLLKQYNRPLLNFTNNIESIKLNDKINLEHIFLLNPAAMLIEKKVKDNTHSNSKAIDLSEIDYTLKVLRRNIEAEE